MEPFDTKLLARIAEGEPDEIDVWEKRVIRLYRRARNLQDSTGTIKFRQLEKCRKLMVRRLALLPPAELSAHKRHTLLYFRRARNIHKKADVEAQQVWQRVVERSRRGADGRRP